MSYLVEVTIQRGQNATLTWLYPDATNPADLTGWGAEARFSDLRGRTLASFTTAAGGITVDATGHVTLILPGAVTGLWEWWNGRIVVTLTDPDGAGHAFLEGTFLAADEVTTTTEILGGGIVVVEGDFVTQAALTGEASTRAAQDSALAVALDEETTARVAGDSAVDVRVDALEAVPAVDAYTRTETDGLVTDEAAARAAADATLTQAVTDEQTARAAADAVLAQAVTDEQTAREAADATLTTAVGGKAPTVHTHTSASIDDFVEAVQDVLGATLVGTGVTVTYDDAAGEVRITSAGGGGSTDLEAVRDAIGVALIGVGNIGVAVDDAADTITITTSATQNSTDAALRDRTTHTGLQPTSSIDGLDAALAAKAVAADVVHTDDLLDEMSARFDQGRGIVINNPYPGLITITNGAALLTPFWNTFADYLINDMVIYGGLLYKSLTNDNYGNQPDTSPTEWAVVPLTAAAHIHGVDDLDSTGATAGQVPVADGAGATTWESPAGVDLSSYPDATGQTAGKVPTTDGSDGYTFETPADPGAPQTIAAKTANYTLVAGDVSKLITMNSGSGLTLSVPTDAAVSWPVGARVDVLVIGAGMVTVAAVTPGTTTVTGTPSLVSRARWSAFTLQKIAANTWVAIGDLA